jgi:hypothetical protein
MSRAIRPGENTFSALASSDDDSPPDAGPPAAPEPDPESESPILSRFVRGMKSDQPALAALSAAAHAALRIGSQQQSDWCANFENYDALDPAAYAEKLRERARCFGRLHEPAVLEFVDAQLAALGRPSDFAARVAETAQLLASEKRRAGHGQLFVLGRALRLFPDLARELAVRDPVVAPVVCWLLRYAMEGRPHCIPTRALLAIFAEPLVSRDQAFGPASVAAAHLIRMSVGKRVALPASLYVYLFHVSHLTGSNRNAHVAGVVRPLLAAQRIRVMDMENFARVLITRYPNCPRPVAHAFLVSSTKHTKFFKGWLSYHSQKPKNAMVYLDVVGELLPQDLLVQFPIEDLENAESPNRRLAGRRKRLSSASWKFLLLIIVAGILATTR